MLPARQFGRRFPAAAVAGVWLYHGLWCKLLGRCPEQAAIVAELPGVRGGRAKALLLGLGAAETALAAWVISGARPRLAAATGTTLVATMNVGGFAFGRARVLGPVVGWSRSKREKYCELDDVEVQSRLWQAQLDNPRFRAAAALVLSPLALRRAYARDFVAAAPRRFDIALRRRLGR